MHASLPLFFVKIHDISIGPTGVKHIPPPQPVVVNGNIYGPHLYAVPASQYSGPALGLTDVMNSPVLVVVKNPSSLSYDMAYAISGLRNLDRDTNSQNIARMLLHHNDKVSVSLKSSMGGHHGL